MQCGSLPQYARSLSHRPTITSLGSTLLKNQPVKVARPAPPPPLHKAEVLLGGELEKICYPRETFLLLRGRGAGSATSTACREGLAQTGNPSRMTGTIANSCKPKRLGPLCSKQKRQYFSHGTQGLENNPGHTEEPDTLIVSLLQCIDLDRI